MLELSEDCGPAFCLYLCSAALYVVLSEIGAALGLSRKRELLLRCASRGEPDRFTRRLAVGARFFGGWVLSSQHPTTSGKPSPPLFFCPWVSCVRLKTS